MSAPKIQTPDVFAPLWTQPARYKGAWGGRGSAKSNDRAQALIVDHLRNPGLRSICLREVQKSIKQSVYQLIADWLERMSVGPEFDVMRDEIKAPGGGVILFQGMQDHTAASIKSLEGVGLAWFEEAQTCTQRSLDLLRPTIRMPGSELWFTWNPDQPTDPVDALLRGNRPDSAVVVRANYCDNPWFPAELEMERQLDEAGDEGRYRWIWLGDYQDASDTQLISRKDVERAQASKPHVEPHDECIMGVDVARFGDDETVIAFRRGRDAYSEPWLTFRKLDTMETAARVAFHIERMKPDAVFIDETGVGAGVVDRLRQLGFPVTPVNFGAKADGFTREKAANKRAEMWLRMREWLRSDVGIPKDDGLANELTGPQYRHDAQNAILIERKEDMKKRGLKSPDKADALALTFAYPVMRSADNDDFEPHHELSRAGY